MWNVYHYRGVLQQSFPTEAEALAWIQSQKIPSEYYKELANVHALPAK